jgi:hypothetical protein
MTASGISLVDANVWLAIAVDGHIHHSAAVRQDPYLDTPGA